MTCIVVLRALEGGVSGRGTHLNVLDVENMKAQPVSLLSDMQVYLNWWFIAHDVENLKAQLC